VIDSQTEELNFDLDPVTTVAFYGDGKHCLDGDSIRRAATAKPKRAGKATKGAPPERRPPYILEAEVNCDECGGTGFDPGGIDPWGPEPCPACRGAKRQLITRNFLAEAFQIAANSESTRPIERQHLVAVIQHCRQAVSALVSLPEVA
jgi:hypothetical protein